MFLNSGMRRRRLGSAGQAGNRLILAHSALKNGSSFLGTYFFFCTLPCSTNHCWNRFTKLEVDALIVALDVPDRVCCDNGASEPAHIALPMLLRRLAYPARYVDIFHAFGWEKTRFSRVTRTLAAFLYHRWSHILYFDPSRLNRFKLAEYAKKVHDKGSALPNVWGFVDGTLRRTARPVRNQRILYNGWKRIHALKFHPVVTPDGFHSHLFGPIEGRRHDETVYQQSGLSGFSITTPSHPMAPLLLSMVILPMDCPSTSSRHSRGPI